MEKRRGFIASLILIVVAVILCLFLIGAFRPGERPYGISFKQLLHLPCGLRLYGLKKDSVVAFPFTVRGYANGCGWEIDTEGRLGTLDILADNGVYLGSYILQAKGDTRRSPYYFEGIVEPKLPYTVKKGTFVFTPFIQNGKTLVIPVTFK